MTKIKLFLLAAVAATLPLERLPSLEIGGLTVRIPHILFLVLLGVILLSFKNIRKIKVDKADLVLLIFWLVVLLSFIAGGVSRRSMLVFLFLIFASVAYWVFKYTTKEPQKLIKYLYYGTVLTLIIGAWQFVADTLGLGENVTGLRHLYTKEIFGFPRIQGTLSEPLYFANFLFLPIGFLLAEYLEHGKLTLSKWALLLVCLLEFMLTVSRGANIGLLFMMAVFLVFAVKVKKLKTLGALLLAVISTWALSLALILISGRVSGNIRSSANFLHQEAIADIGQSESSNSRLQAWREALNMGLGKPVLGIGPGNYGVKSLLPKDIAKNGYPIVNNEYIELFAETGAVGFTAFGLFMALLLGGAYKTYAKTHSPTVLGGMLASAGILFHYLTFSTLYILYIWVLWGIMANKNEE